VLEQLEIVATLPGSRLTYGDRGLIRAEMICPPISGFEEMVAAAKVGSKYPSPRSMILAQN